MLGNVNFFSNLTPAQIKKYDLNGDGKLSDSEKDAAQKSMEQETPQPQTSSNDIPLDYTFGVMISQYSASAEETKQFYDTQADARKAFNSMKESFIENYIKQIQENSSLTDDERKSLIAFINSKSAAFIDQYFKKNTKGPYDIAEITSQYTENIQQLLAQREEKNAEIKEMLSKFSQVSDEDLEKLAEMIESADADYITDKEYEEIKNQATDYIIGKMLQGEDITAFLSAINPNFKNNQNYNIVKSCIDTIQKETDPEKVEYYIKRAQEYISKILGEKSEDGTSKLTDAIKAQNLAGAKKEASNQIEEINDVLIEKYFANKTELDEEFTTDDVNALAKKYENIKNAFLAQYTGDGSDIETAYNEYLNKVEQETQEVLAQIETQKGNSNSYENLTNTVKDAGVNLTAEEQENIKSAAIDYIISTLMNGDGETDLLADLLPDYKTNSKYLLAKQLLEGIATSATPKEDYEKALELLHEMESSLSTTQIKQAMKNEETRIKKAQQEKYGAQLDTLIDQLIENYAEEKRTYGLFKKEKYAHSDSQVEQYKQKLANVKTAFLEQYTGDGSDLEAKFNEYLNKVNSESAEVNKEISSKKDSEKAYEEIKNAIDNAGRNISKEEEKDIKEKTADYILSVMLNGTTDASLLSSLLPGYKTDGKYTLAKQLIEGLASSTTPKEDWELAQKLINELLENISVTTVENTIESEERKNVNLSVSQISEDVWGYNNKDTYGQDDDVYPYFTIEDGKISYTHSKDGKDVTKAMEDVLENIKEVLQEQLGDLYNEEEINNCFNQAQINAMLGINSRALTTIANLVNLVLDEFNTLMTDSLHNEKDSSFVKSNYGDSSLLDGIEEFYGKDDRFYYKETGIDKNGDVYLNHSDNTDFQNTIDELSRRIIEKYKSALGDQLSKADIERLEDYIQDAVSKALDVMKSNKILAWGKTCKGDGYKNSFNVLVKQTLFELDKILKENPIG